MKNAVTMGFGILAGLLMTVSTAVAADLPAALVGSYLRVQEALVADKTDGLKAEAGMIAREAARLGPDAAKIQAASTKLVVASDLKTARTAFGELSEAIFAYAAATNSSLGPDLHEVYCPMVRKPWLQKGRAIRNPYYGKAMLTCGEVKR